MAKKMLIDATHTEETRVVVVDGNKVEEFDFESENKRQLAGNIYLAKVTRVEPSLQAAFVDYGGNRHGFLAFSEIHPDYYQIPVADREALMEEERAYADALRARDDVEEKKKPRRRSSRAAKAKNNDAVTSTEIDGMETIDLDSDAAATSPAPETSETAGRETAGPETAAPEAAAPDAAVDADAPEATEAAATEAPQEAPAAETEAKADAPEADGDAEAPKDDAAEAGSDQATEADAKTSAPAEPDGEDDDTADAVSSDATAKDESIESVADDDDIDDIRPPRKPRARRYKIQEVIKVRQILLVQVVKEERGNKGAALTTYLSLAGRYCVLMPNTARGGGISRKITNAPDRKKLKEIAGTMEVPQGAGLIVRTAGAKRTKAEIKRDYEYLQRMWEQIRELTLQSIAPAKIYEEGDLIKRSIRDLYNRDIDEVLVEGDRGYRNAKDFMKMIMPFHAKNVQKYEDQMPLFARFQVESYLGGMFNPTVQLKSGGYIVIGVTEALVAIDVNSGRATKEGSIEETALKTNLEASEEVARQLRLRDLAGLIVIDFIDMDERKNNAAVEKRMKDKLKTDRARIQVGRISGFGLMEMSRQRLRPGMIEATTQPCTACHGTGLIRSDDSLSLQILRAIEEEGTRRRSREVLIKCPVDIANFLMNQKREHVAQIEGRYGMAVRIEGDPKLVSPDFTLEKFKTATRNVTAVAAPVISADAALMDQIDEDETVVEAENEAPEATTQESEEGKPKRRRRRRRSRGRGRKEQGEENVASGEGSGEAAGEGAEGQADAAAPTGEAAAAPADGDAAPEAAVEAKAPAADAPEATEEAAAEEEKPKKRRSRSRKKKTDEATADAVAADAAPADAVAAEATPADAAPADAAEPAAEEKPKRKRATRSRAKKKVEVAEEGAPDAAAEAAPAAEPSPEPEAAPAPETKAARPRKRAAAKTAVEPAAEAVKETAAAEPDPAPAAEAEPDKPKRRGWWSLGRS